MRRGSLITHHVSQPKGAFEGSINPGLFEDIQVVADILKSQV